MIIQGGDCFFRDIELRRIKDNLIPYVTMLITEAAVLFVLILWDAKKNNIQS